MAARKGKGRQAVRNGGWPAWIWVVIGLVIGAIGMAAVMRGGYLPITRKHDGPTPNPQATAQRGSEPGVADQAQKKPSYDFYSVLPEKEVVIPDAEISKQAKAESGNASANTASSPASAGSGTGYLLQVGSFPSASDADAVKAKLALQGFVANVQQVTVNGQTWNRVRLGPYKSASDLEAVKKKLTAAGIHAIALKETQ
ncbi:SPOR domain-containing protein [Oleiagrimonas sp. C23AA]|uniref:SPOR domain-containing protein n=1 Tax=Oleiagrimonas sp. C23AA TaxID=2719047 RepID=UPI00142164B8|nr:SPOR domain-containing protein [Oleiagrimonas sp. C23AA]NII10596.1 SPOR domain-containing protein [Oleiagrimonas sp. C23AA]